MHAPGDRVCFRSPAHFVIIHNFSSHRNALPSNYINTFCVLWVTRKHSHPPASARGDGGAGWRLLLLSNIFFMQLGVICLCWKVAMPSKQLGLCTATTKKKRKKKSLTLEHSIPWRVCLWVKIVRWTGNFTLIHKSTNCVSIARKLLWAAPCSLSELAKQSRSSWSEGRAAVVFIAMGCYAAAATAPAFWCITAKTSTSYE